jgi:RarD protein
MQQNKAKLELAVSMFIFGTIGIVRHLLPFPSLLVSEGRSLFGALFILLCMLLLRRRPDGKAIRKNLALLAASGFCLSFNWYFLLESYVYTTVAIGTVCYYMAPVFITLLAPVFLKEKLSVHRLLCVAAAVVGIVLVSGLGGGEELPEGTLLGVLCGLAAACFYTGLVFLNKKLKNISGMDRTLVQLAMASVALLPLMLLTEDVRTLDWSARNIGLLVLLGVVHTGISYMLYLSPLEYVDAQTAALLSYIDPLVAVLSSALILHEPMTPTGWLGAVLVLGSTLVGEILDRRNPAPVAVQNPDCGQEDGQS